jgi:D-alanyl-D-alanine carboxypeptidase
VVDINFKNLKIVKKKIKELGKYEVANLPLPFADGTLLKIEGTNKIFVMEKNRKRRIADDDTFIAMGYKKSNIITIPFATAINLQEGDGIYLNAGLMSSKNKFLGDSEADIKDLFGSKVPAYLVAEYPSGRIISGKDIDTRRPMASLTKLMTAYEALAQDYNLKGSTVYKDAEHKSYNNPLGLVTGEKIKNLDIFNAMLVGSINNLARMVAKSNGMSEEDFISSMNSRLEEWGADNTSLADETGLDENNKSTPRDLLKIFTKVLSNTTIKNSLSQTDYTFKELVDKNKVAKHTITNTNQIIGLKNRNYRILAGKTGYIDEGGAVLIMLIESKKDKKQYIVTTMGNMDYKNRFEEPAKIAKWISAGNVELASKK